MTIQQGDTKITELPTLPKTGGYDYEYDLRDHLGNTRVTCKGVFDVNGNITSTVVMQKNSYYPAVYPEEIGGLLHGGKNTIATNKYLYNGKELQSDYNFDLYSLSRCVGNYGARFYDGQLDRCHSIDPMIEKHYNYTPYAYVYNNPIKLIDPFGLDSVIVHRSEASSNGFANTYKLTFSIVRSGVEESYPLDLEQASNSEWVQVPENTDVKLDFQQMGKNLGKKGYENTIRVYLPMKKSDSEDYAVFMHPTSYSLVFLRGCLATADNLNENGRVPDATPADEFKATVEALSKIRELYDYANGGKKGDKLTGDKFIMRTNSKAPEQEKE